MLNTFKSYLTNNQYIIIMKLYKKEIIYNLKWQLNFNHNYKITECKKIINTNTGRMINPTVVGYTIGYWIGRKFIARKKLNDYCEKINVLSLVKMKDLYPNLYKHE